MKLKVIDYGFTKLPNRAHYNDSGADVFAIEDVIIQPKSVEAIGLGLGVELPDGYDLIIHCKSGLSKNGVWASNSPIDAGYTGEIHAILYNTNDCPFVIRQGEKLGQLVMRPVIYPEFVTELNDDRGAGAFGSTGK